MGIITVVKIEMMHFEEETEEFLEGFRKLLDEAKLRGKGSVFITMKRMIRRNRLDQSLVERICFLRVHCGSKKFSICVPADVNLQAIKSEGKDISTNSKSNKNIYISNEKSHIQKIKEQFISTLNEIITNNLNVLVNTYNIKKKKKVKKTFRKVFKFFN